MPTKKSYLLIDFGASRIKSALLVDGKISDVQSHDSIEPCVLEDKKFEVDILKIKEKFLNIAKNYYDKVKFEGIFICSEMHGFALLNEKNEPISNYISWKDERCTNKIDDVSSLDLLKTKLGKTFFEKTGMNPRACYPIFNLFHMIRENKIKKAKIVSLPEWLCCCSDNSLNVAHCTMSAGLGFYNIISNTFDEELIKAVAGENVELSFNKPSQKVEIGGYLTLDEMNIPIYTGVGDHQCAVLGAGNDENSISVNLGTGSQVAMINLDNKICEKRPYFNEETLSVITHIPSGRALNQYVGFLENINPDKNFWQELDKISLEEIKNSTLEFDLAIFTSAWGYTNGGSIKGISEKDFDLTNYLASLLKSYILQYKKAIEFLKPSSKFDKIILSGGVANKLPIIKDYLKEIMEYNVVLSGNKFDETFVGLKKLVEQNT